MSNLKIRVSINMLASVVSVASFFALAACAGGSSRAPLSGGGGGGGGLSSPDPLAPEQPAASFVTPEFSPCFTLSVPPGTFCDDSKGTIGAEDVYAKGAYGGGVVVAVIDSGIDTSNDDLAANISPDSIDIVSPTTPLDDQLDHGTMVAGVIAADRNGFGTMGVAFDATVLAIRADGRTSGGLSTGSFAIPDVTAGIQYATGRAHVINLSLGIPDTKLGDPFGSTPAEEAAFEQALINAMAAEAIVVVATGNEGVAEATLPAAYAGDAVVNASGQMLAVGATTNAGDALATFSNQCGSAMDFCLVAPGEEIWTSFPGNNFALVEGTSFSAPLVAGSAALLIQLWPTLTPAEVVDILLSTATDLGATGVDAVYGHGLLNLSAAIQPMGDLTIPTTSAAGGAAVPLDGTVLSLGPAFGDALAGLRVLGQALALDDFERDFGAGLQGHVIRAEGGFGLDTLLADGAIESVESALPNGARVSMGVRDRTLADPATHWTGMAADRVPYREVAGMSVAIAAPDGTGYRLGYDVMPGQIAPDATAGQSSSLFWMSVDLLSPQHTLVGAGTAASVSRTLGEGNILTLGVVDQGDTAGGDSGDAQIGEIVLARQFSGGAVLTARFSVVDEQHGFLGSDAEGGFAVEGANSQFYVLGARYPVTAGVELLGSYTLARTDMVADGTSLLSDWTGTRADAFGLGIVKRSIFGTEDRIGVLAGQPLRVAASSATLTLPVGYEEDKTVVQKAQRVSLVPTGREIDLQLAYDTPVAARGSLSGWLMMQLEPGHVADAPPAYGIGLRFGMPF